VDCAIGCVLGAVRALHREIVCQRGTRRSIGLITAPASSTVPTSSSSSPEMSRRSWGATPANGGAGWSSSSHVDAAATPGTGGAWGGGSTALFGSVLATPVVLGGGVIRPHASPDLPRGPSPSSSVLAPVATHAATGDALGASLRAAAADPGAMGRLESLLAALTGMGADVLHAALRSQNSYGWTALHQAVHASNMPAVGALLAAGSPVEVPARTQSASRLWQGGATGEYHRRDHDDVVMISTLPVALRMATEDIIVALLRAGARFERDGVGREMSTLIQRGWLTAFAAMLAAGADPNRAAPVPDTLMHVACRSTCAAECIPLLLRHGASPHIVGVRGVLPMHVAAEAGCLPAIQQLVAAGVSCNVSRCASSVGTQSGGGGGEHASVISN